MQTEEWMKRRKEEQRILGSHDLLTKQVNENIEKLENRNGDLFSNNKCDSSTVFVETSPENVYIKQVEFNTRMMLKLEKRISELEHKLAELNL